MAVASEFVLSWERGNSKGATDSRKPDSSNVLTFAAQFECQCKMFVDKSDGHVRPKSVKITLARLVSRSNSKVYAKTAVDISAFFNAAGPSTFSGEMESGRGKAPTLHATFWFHRAEQEIQATSADADDPSFLEEGTKHIPIDRWDGSEDERLSPTDKKKKKTTWTRH
jgi:hypothetical protein